MPEVSEETRQKMAAIEEKAAARVLAHSSKDASLKMKAAARAREAQRVGEPTVAERLSDAASMLQPKYDPKEDLRRAAQAAIGFVKEQADKRKDRVNEAQSDEMFYVRCQHCNGPGLWMDNRSTLNDDNWWTSYKPKGVPWPGKQVWCQVCYIQSGARRQLKILHQPGPDGNPLFMRPYPRMIVKISASEYNRLMGEPETADAG